MAIPYYSSSCYSALPKPNFDNTVSARHQLVNDDCNKLSPTNNVSRYQYGLTKYPRPKLSVIIVPAKRRTMRSIGDKTLHEFGLSDIDIELDLSGFFYI